jgi:PHP family Zn ribbon phosphoesterase
MRTESAEAAEKRRARDRVKKAKKVVRRRLERLALLKPGTSKTDPAYRRKLPALPEMSKNELRAMIAQAVRHTAEMPI